MGYAQVDLIRDLTPSKSRDGLMTEVGLIGCFLPGLGKLDQRDKEVGLDGLPFHRRTLK